MKLINLRNNFKGKKILITGAAGFIGSNLVHFLSSTDAEIILPVKEETDLWRLKNLKNILYVKMNLLDLKETLKIFDLYKPDYVFHFASAGGHSPSLESFHNRVKNDIIMTSNILEASSISKVSKFIQGGSSLEGHISEGIMYENNTFKPRTYRGILKASSSMLCNYYSEYKDLNLINARIFCAYGPWEQPTRFIPNIVLSYIKHTSISLVNPKYKRDYIYIDDIIKALILILISNTIPSGTLINLGSGKLYSAWDINNTLSEICNFNIEINQNEYSPKDPDKDPYIADLSNLKKYLNWQPEYSIITGLSETVNWFKENMLLYE